MKVVSGKDLMDLFGAMHTLDDEIARLNVPRPAWWRRVLLRLAGYDYRDFRLRTKPAVPSIRPRSLGTEPPR